MNKFFRIPFALTGARAAVPFPDPGTGEVNYETGYPAQYQLPKTDPASRNIERDKMNQLFYDMTAAIAELQSTGTPDFITSALNGGVAYSYGLGARVRYDDGVNGPRVFQSLKNANTSLPTVAADWSQGVLLSDFSGVGRQLLEANGFQRLPGGLVMQWGTALVNGTATILYPLAFPSAVLLALATDAEGTTSNFTISAATPNLTQLQLAAQGGANAGAVFWFALGK